MSPLSCDALKAPHVASFLFAKNFSTRGFYHSQRSIQDEKSGTERTMFRLTARTRARLWRPQRICAVTAIRVRLLWQSPVGFGGASARRGWGRRLIYERTTAFAPCPKKHASGVKPLVELRWFASWKVSTRWLFRRGCSPADLGVLCSQQQVGDVRVCHTLPK